MKPARLIIASLFFFILAAILSSYTGLFSNKTNYTENLKRVLYLKNDRALIYFDKLEHAEIHECQKILNRAENEKIILLKYSSDTLSLWSSNSIPIYSFYPDSIYSHKIIRFFNSYYFVVKREINDSKYIGLIHIKSRFPYQNDYLNNEFNADFDLPSSTILRFQPNEGIPIYDRDKTYLFSIIIPSEQVPDSPNHTLATIFLFIGFFGFGLFIIQVLANIDNVAQRNYILFLFIGGIFLVRIVQLILGVNFSGFVLFDPFLFADSTLVPSLGDLLLNSMIIFLSAYLLFRYIRLSEIKLKKSVHFIVLLAMHGWVFLYFLNANYFSFSLINNSSIPFQPNKIDQLSINSILCFLINGINYLSFALVLFWVIKYLVKRGRLTLLIIPSMAWVALGYSIIYLLGYPADWYSPLFLFLIYWIFIWFFSGKTRLISYSILEIIFLVFTFYLVVFISSKSKIKDNSVKSALAVGLSNEHDPVAEYLLEGLGASIEKDTVLLNRLNEKYSDVNRFYEYLKKSYFSGFWGNYDMQITLCRPGDSVLIESPEYQWFQCYNFFNSIVKEVGYALPNSRFYYLENFTGRISYLGIIKFNLNTLPKEITLYIELNSRLSNDLLGYPELLLDKKLRQDRPLDRYSYAKYYSGSLVSKSGDYIYNKSSVMFGEIKNPIQKVKLNGYEHLVIKTDKENLIVISNQSVTFVDMLVLFSYLFMFYYLILLIILGINRIKNRDLRPFGNLRGKIQFTIIGILIVSLLLIAVSTIFLSIGNYKKTQNKMLNEKIQSVVVELYSRFAVENEISPIWSSARYDNLNQLLIRFSNVFYTDINLYSPGGDLMATSRMEIFQTGLQGQKMDPTAFWMMNHEQSSMYIHREKISRLDYLSVYVPFTNANGKILAYLNLPYFSKQKELQSSISALVLTIFNIYIILILLTIFTTVFISDQITHPLVLMQQRLSELKLGGRHEAISYKRNDEIGNLVTEYNNMVIELERSVDLLARSERESAWREMAKQIAHEIKNPLTPMRLSVQQLERSWKDGSENHGQYLERVCQTLIEQIDTLSAIASEFSNFAKMPSTKLEHFNLVPVVRSVYDLFSGNANYDLSFKSPIESVFVKADKEQLSRVFINIVKNGIQSLAEGSIGKIDVTITEDKHWAIVIIKDNGKGIPEEVQPNLFTPNFTTKTSGMGLGLAIVKNTIDQLQGEIEFETAIDKGTSFIVKIPRDI